VVKERKKRERRGFDTASTFTPPLHIVCIAAERTRAITRKWSEGIAYSPADFMLLAKSCYMQGMNDMVDAALRAGWIPDGTPEPVTKHFGDLP
jgi:hypothetical protein